MNWGHHKVVLDGQKAAGLQSRHLQQSPCLPRPPSVSNSQHAKLRKSFEGLHSTPSSSVGIRVAMWTPCTLSLCRACHTTLWHNCFACILMHVSCYGHKWCVQKISTYVLNSHGGCLQHAATYSRSWYSYMYSQFHSSEPVSSVLLTSKTSTNMSPDPPVVFHASIGSKHR